MNRNLCVCFCAGKKIYDRIFLGKTKLGRICPFFVQNLCVKAALPVVATKY